MTKRFVGKVSDYNLKDSLINLIAKMLGVKPSEIKLSEETLTNIKQRQDEQLGIKKIINPFYETLKYQNSRNSYKKIDELIDLGKLIYCLKLENEIKIIECDEQPDFIIKFQDELIGIEHTGIYDDGVVKEINKLKSIISKCQAKLINERSDIIGLFNIVVNPSKLKGQLPFKKDTVIQIICEVITAKHEKKDIKKSDFIIDVIQEQHSTLELNLAEDYLLIELTPESISKAILKKENKIETYKSLKKLNKCWLLIVIDGASSASSFSINLYDLPKNLTPFDKIYIFDKFKNEIIIGEVK